MEKDSKTKRESDQLKMVNVSEPVFLKLPCQGSIYSLSAIKNNEDATVLIIGTLEKIYILQNSENYDLMEISVPTSLLGLDIIAISTSQTSSDDVIIGAIFLEKENTSNKTEAHLCPFNFKRSEKSFECESLSTVELSYIPYQLYSTSCIINDSQENVWLSSVASCNFHMYRFSNDSVYEETNINEYFPELNKVRDIYLSLSINYSEDNKTRTTLLGGESGIVNLFEVNVDDRKIIWDREIRWDFPVSSVQLFSIFSQELCAVVTTSLEGAYYYSNIRDNGVKLVNSDANDVVTCSLVCDINFDGKKEILLGTFGKVLSIYSTFEESWDLIKRIILPSPILSMAYEDINGSGISSLIVVTQTGIHIYEHCAQDCMEEIRSRVKKLSLETQSATEPLSNS